MGYGERKSDRVRFEHRYPMNLMGVDGTWRRSCVMLDVSETGAKLEVRLPAGLANEQMAAVIEWGVTELKKHAAESNAQKTSQE